MNRQDFTLFPLSSLPVSNHRLLDFHCLQHLRCNPLESIFIQPPPGKSGFGTDGDIFKHPLQITILGITGNQVDLGVYAHPSLVVRQGPYPNKYWRRNRRKACARWAVNTWPPEDIKAMLNRLCDEVHRLRSLHDLGSERQDSQLDTGDREPDPLFAAGLRPFFIWLIERDRAFHDEVERLLARQRLDKDKDAGDNTENT